MNVRMTRGLAQAAAALALAATWFASSAAAQPLTVERVVAGLSRPVFVTMPPGDMNRLFIVEQHSGLIRIYDRVNEMLLGTEFLDVPGLSTGNEQGLLGLAFHPNYGSNGFFYVNFTDNIDDSTHVVRYQANDPNNPNIADAGSATEVLSFSQPQSNHNGGWIGFGPDGYLYIASGDGGGANDQGSGHTEPGGNAQDIDGNFLGKMLRIDVDGDDFPGDPDRNYAVPATNPFVGIAGDDEIWAYGLRNPWRNSFDQMTGDLYIGDVGQGVREEINVQPAASSGGENYGWRLREGTIQTPGSVGGAKPAGAIDPIYDYPHGGGPTEGFVVTGGYVYRGPILSLQGRYFFSDYATERIWSLVWDGSAPNAFDGTNYTDFVDHTDTMIVDAGTVDEVASFGEDPAGNLFIVDLGGEVFQITGAGPPLGNTDHFLLYKIKGTSGEPRFAKFGPVTLADQFRTEDYNVIKPATLGLPGDKNAEGVFDAVTHLTEYMIKPAEGAADFAKISDVHIVNQCNSLYVQIVKPASLLVPTSKNLMSQPLPPDPMDHELDHFLCYKARNQTKLSDDTPLPKFPKRMQVEVVSQFDDMAARRYDLKRVTKLCNPVDKSGMPSFLSGDNEGDPKPITPATIENPVDHLVCYKAVLSRKTVAQNGCVPADPDDTGTDIEPPQAKHAKLIGFFINNQFGPEHLDSQKEVELCIPSLKFAP
jgi:glucose/arabinose dehydrogenase